VDVGYPGQPVLAITFLAGQMHAVPSEQETVISQLARTVLGGRNGLYLATIGATTLILIMAANTAFADFPRLSALHAGDGFLPRQLTYRGSRLVFSRGIVLLAVIASLLIIVFDASVTALIPLYAIGVFLSFSLSQLGMARRWWKIGHMPPGEEVREPGSVLRYTPGWQWKLAVNALGSVCTFVVMVIFAITKSGTAPGSSWCWCRPWCSSSSASTIITKTWPAAYRSSTMARRRPSAATGVIVPISTVHRGSLAALDYARSLSSDVTAIHVSIDRPRPKRCEPSGRSGATACGW